MCLLLNIPATTEFDKEDILDFYDHNKDGIGVMFAENNTLHVQKVLPRTGEDAWAFYLDAIKGRNCVAHFRLKTHGDIDLTNCHPYRVFGEGEADTSVYMAHNGVLSTGNAADKSKSDTWHYIEDYLKPIAQGNSEILFVPAFISMVEKHIGSGNKFVFMDATGRVAVVNQSAFVQYKGADLSNTYAWTASRGGFGPRNYYAGGMYPRHWSGGWEDDDTFFGGFSGSPKKKPDPYDSREAYEFARDLFARLREVKYNEAHKALTYDEAKKYFVALGKPLCDDLFDAIKEQKLQEAEVITYIRTKRAYGLASVTNLPVPAGTKFSTLTAGMDYAADFFTVCRHKGLALAFNHFSAQDIEQYHDAVGEEDAQKYLDKMDSGQLTSRHVIEDVEKVLLNATLAQQEAVGGA